jgi:hypothetical protein
VVGKKLAPNRFSASKPLFWTRLAGQFFDGRSLHKPDSAKSLVGEIMNQQAKALSLA